MPRGGIEAKEIWLCFQIAGTHARAGTSNNNTNKIFLWIGSVPGYRSIRSMPSHPNLSQKRSVEQVAGPLPLISRHLIALRLEDGGKVVSSKRDGTELELVRDGVADRRFDQLGITRCGELRFDLAGSDLRRLEQI